MVERPAEVHSLDPAKPVKFDWFTRADRALRRTPGIGVAFTLFLLEYTYDRGRIGLLVLLSVLAVMVLLNEFLPEITKGFSPKLSGAPSAQPQRPDPTSAV